MDCGSLPSLVWWQVQFLRPPHGGFWTSGVQIRKSSRHNYPEVTSLSGNFRRPEVPFWFLISMGPNGIRYSDNRCTYELLVRIVKNGFSDLLPDSSESVSHLPFWTAWYSDTASYPCFQSSHNLLHFCQESKFSPASAEGMQAGRARLARWLLGSWSPCLTCAEIPYGNRF